MGPFDGNKFKAFVNDALAQLISLAVGEKNNSIPLTFAILSKGDALHDVNCFHPQRRVGPDKSLI
jgi:hypothetical protein